MANEKTSAFRTTATFILGTLGTLASLYGIYQLSEQISAPLVPQLINQKSTGHKLAADAYEINVLLLTLLIILLIITLCIIATALHSLMKAPRDKDAALVKSIQHTEEKDKELRQKEETIKEREKETKEVLDAYNRLIGSAKQITDGIYPSSTTIRPARLIIESIDTVIDIYEGFGAKVIKTYKVKCNDQPAHFYRYWFAADNSAPELVTLDMSDFLAKFVEGGGDISSLPFLNDPRKKGIALFFLPALQPQQTATFQIHYSWPGFFADLGATGSSIYFIHLENGGVARVSCVFSFENSLGDIDASLINFADGTLLKKEVNKNSRSWIYTNNNFRCDGSEYQIRFSLVGKSKTASIS